MEEITYLSTPGATVTSSRIAIGMQTFATRNVGSVSVERVDKPSWPIYMGLVGGAMTISAATSSSFGASGIMGVVILIGCAAVALSPIKLRLKLMAGGGEVVALESTDKAAVTALHQAIVSAIAAR